MTDAPPAAEEKKPFVGPRPLQIGEPLFGRDRELRDLYDLLGVERLVLMHSPSGAGKTSLVQAGLIPRLRREGFRVYGPLRVHQRAAPAAETAPGNYHVLSVLRSLEKLAPPHPKVPAERLPELTLPRLFKEWLPPGGPEQDEFLFFDQFEEVLTAESQERDAKRAFFEQLGQLLRSPRRHALFAMREEFVAALDPYLSRVPRGLSARFRLDLLEVEAARAAIVGPAEVFGVKITEGAATRLIDDLRLENVQGRDDTVRPELGRYVEPVHLQIVCLALWEGRKGAREISAKDVADVVVDVDNALGAYYAAKVQAVARETGVPERDIREWCQRQLITKDNTRDQVRRGKEVSRDLSNRAIDALVDAYLVRREERRDATWYELAHDRLINPIRQNNAAWLRRFAEALPSERKDGAHLSEAIGSGEAAAPGGVRAAELEISISQSSAYEYAIELRYRPPDGESEARWGPGVIPIDFERLGSLFLSPEAYGDALTQQVLGQSDQLDFCRKARVAAQAAGVPLGVRLSISASAPELHGLRWELLRAPWSVAPLLADEAVLFSRYVSGPDYRPIRLRSAGPRSALVAIANPTDLDRYAPGGRPLAPVGVEAVSAKARAVLEGFEVRELVPRSPGEAGLTLARLLERLREGCEVLFLACPTVLIKGEPRLWLEKGDGSADVISARELAARLAELRYPPLVVVLPWGVTAGLGLTLTEIGAVPAVVALQDILTQETGDRLLVGFFRELLRDGRVDRAMAVARTAVRDRSDWWAVVLFSRVRTGRLWYGPGSSGASAGGAFSSGAFDPWPALLTAVARSRCTPILGFGLLEELVGSTRELAYRWAGALDFPQRPGERDDLAQVSQYLAVTRGLRYPHEMLAERLREQVARRFPELPLSASVGDLLEAARDRLGRGGRPDPHAILAKLPFPLYLTITPDDQLVRALLASGKAPTVAACPWREGLEEGPGRPDLAYEPSPDRPLVYHLFGRLEWPDSLVLTEDDFFQFLIGVSRLRERVPPVVLASLARSALLLVGFRLAERAFRVLLHSLLALVHLEGLPRRYAHLVVLAPPEEDQVLDPGRARAYAEEQLRGIDARTYWGTAEEFTRELGQRWLAAHPEGRS